MDYTLKFALIGVLGIGSQWVAWRTGWPAIALMLIAGIAAGPVLGLINPAQDFGELLTPMISVAVAVILFEGGLSLNFRELKQAGSGVLRLTTAGVALGWALGTAAAHYLAGLDLPVAILFAGILVVTGPTVIGPLLRQLNLAKRPRTLLKWEAIVNDPIGALLAVFTFEYLSYSAEGSTLADITLWILAASAVAIAIGVALAFAVAWLFPRGMVPEYLKAPVVLVAVIIGYVAADSIEHETGLLTVTAMGIALANMRLSSLAEMRRFKESVTILLISGVFILLSATLDLEVLKAIEWRFVLFLVALLFVVRPITVLVSLMFSKIPWNERLFVAWMAPRGIVAIAISGLFAIRLDELGYADGLALVPLSFAVVIVTIFAHGFTAKPLAARLKLSRSSSSDVLIVGATPWSHALALYLKQLGIGVTITDNSWQRLRPIRQGGIPFFHGEVLSEATQGRLEFGHFQTLIAATENEAYNALVCTDLAPEFGRSSVFQLGHSRPDDPYQLAESLRGRTLFPSGVSVDEANQRHNRNWTFKSSRIGEQNSLADVRERLPKGADFLFVMKKNKELRFFTHARRPSTEAGDTVVAYVPPADMDEQAIQPTAAEAAGGTDAAEGETSKRRKTGTSDPVDVVSPSRSG